MKSSRGFYSLVRCRPRWSVRLRWTVASEMFLLRSCANPPTGQLAADFSLLTVNLRLAFFCWFALCVETFFSRQVIGSSSIPNSNEWHRCPEERFEVPCTCLLFPSTLVLVYCSFSFRSIRTFYTVPFLRRRWCSAMIRLVHLGWWERLWRQTLSESGVRSKTFYLSDVAEGLHRGDGCCCCATAELWYSHRQWRLLRNGLGQRSGVLMTLLQ